MKGDLNDSVGVHKEWPLARPLWAGPGSTACRRACLIQISKEGAQRGWISGPEDKVGKVNETKFQRNFLKCSPSETYPRA